MKNTGICRRAPTSSVVLMAMAVSASGPVPASGNSLFPDTAAAALRIDAKSSIELLRSLPEAKNIGARHNRGYTQGYIENADNLPRAGIKHESLAGRVNIKDQAMAFYCSGNSGGASIATLRIAPSRGHCRGFCFRVGFSGREDRDYPYVIE